VGEVRTWHTRRRAAGEMAVVLKRRGNERPCLTCDKSTVLPTMAPTVAQLVSISAVSPTKSIGYASPSLL
jgi:hypothetical protein